MAPAVGLNQRPSRASAARRLPGRLQGHRRDAGVGWAMLFQDPVTAPHEPLDHAPSGRRARGVQAVLVLDVWEHAFMSTTSRRARQVHRRVLPEHRLVTSRTGSGQERSRPAAPSPGSPRLVTVSPQRHRDGPPDPLEARDMDIRPASYSRMPRHGGESRARHATCVRQNQRGRATPARPADEDDLEGGLHRCR